MAYLVLQDSARFVVLEHDLWNQRAYGWANAQIAVSPTWACGYLSKRKAFGASCFFWVESQTMNPGGIMLIFHRWDVLKGVPKIDDSIAQGSATLAVPCLEMMKPFQGLSRTGVCRPWYTKMKGMSYREQQWHGALFVGNQTQKISSVRALMPTSMMLKESSGTSCYKASLVALETFLTLFHKAVAVQFSQRIFRHPRLAMQVVHICCRYEFDETLAVQSSNGHVRRAWLPWVIQSQIITDPLSLQLSGPHSLGTSSATQPGYRNWAKDNLKQRTWSFCKHDGGSRLYNDDSH